MDEKEKTDFILSIPNDAIDIVVTALCDNNGFKIDPEEAKKVIINYINEQVRSYKQRQALKNVGDNLIEIS